MKTIILSTLFTLFLIGGALLLSNIGNKNIDVSEDNVRIVDGLQIVDIRAKGGYQPRKSVAQAGVPTVIRFNTTSTFDCSLAVRIPSLSWGKMLPSTGITEYDIGTSTEGILSGTCSMGMYNFAIEFK